jgi:hypothetical protein
MSGSSRLHFLCIGEDSAGQARCRELATEFEYSFLAVNAADEVLDLDGKYELVQFVLVNAVHIKKEELTGIVQTVRQIFKDSFICVIADRRIPQDVAEFIKKSGANMVLLENEFFETSRLEFIASQIIRASYVPVKLNEFPKDSVLDFTLYHLMPLNQKLLPVLPKGTPFSEGRMKKLESVGEVFVRRDEVDRYRHYVESHPDLSGQGLKSRCRAQYLSFCNSHSQLIFLLVDQSENASFKEGKWLYDRCEILARDLLTSLSSVGEAWDVVNNSSLGEFGSVERAPTVAAYAGLMSLLGSIGEPVDVMVAALLSDVGMLELSPKITKKLRQSQDLSKLSEEEQQEYRKHPVISLNRCLSRKLQLKDSIKETILCTHERTDGKGFPEARVAAKIPMEAMLIQFSEMIDREAMVKMGQARAPVQQVRHQILEAELNNAKVFSLGFLQKLKPVI